MSALYKIKKLNFLGLMSHWLILLLIILTSVMVYFQLNDTSLFSSSLFPATQQKHKAMAETKSTESNNTSISSSFLIYNNSSYGIRILYPAEWQITEYDNRFIKNFSDIVSFKPRTNTNNVPQKSSLPPTIFIRIWNLSSEPSSLEQFTKTRMESFKHQDIFIVNRNSIRIGLNDAYKVEYRLKAPPSLPPLDLQGFQVWTLQDNNKAFMITYTADPKDYPNYLPIVQTMINSFQIFK
jgi:PsbP-like protein